MTQAERILKKFKDGGITQERLGAELHCRQSAIAGWKQRGVIPVRQQERVLEVARRIGIGLTPTDFFDSASEPSAPVSPNREAAA